MLKNTLISCAAAVIILLPVVELPVKAIYQIAGTMVYIVLANSKTA